MFYAVVAVYVICPKGSGGERKAPAYYEEDNEIVKEIYSCIYYNGMLHYRFIRVQYDRKL